jgi:hypothetical protein
MCFCVIVGLTGLFGPKEDAVAGLAGVRGRRRMGFEDVEGEYCETRGVL